MTWRGSVMGYLPITMLGAVSVGISMWIGLFSGNRWVWSSDDAKLTPTPFPCGSPSSCVGHDPAALQRVDIQNETYYVTFVTGSNNGEALGIRYIKRGDHHWQKGPDSYLYPEWVGRYLAVHKLACGPNYEHKACSLWAPDLPSSGNGQKPGNDRFLVYYSISDDAVRGDKGVKCIGYATAAWPQMALVDSGSPVLCVNGTQANQGAPHAIDPSVMVDDNGRWWLTYGSWSNYGNGTHQGARGGGVWMVGLDPKTGHLSDAALRICGEDFPFCWDADAYDPTSHSPWLNIANHRGYDSPIGYIDGNSIEASYLYNNRQRTGYYYLFVNWFWCCKGPDSTYQIRYGRSRHPTGPFLDRDGTDMKDGGGSLLLKSTMKTKTHTFTGPGHAGILYEEEHDRYVYTTSYEAIDKQNMQLDVFVMEFDAQGWPMLTGPFTSEADSTP
uniref:Endo-1,5-alpha-L-arabinanase A n=1 Tax=Lotharella globosa TaxID=91324 RepID=A0A7S3Z980_9EUKA